MKFLLAFTLALACVSVIFANTKEEACLIAKCDARKAMKCEAGWSIQPTSSGTIGFWVGLCVPDHTAANTCRLPLETGPCRQMNRLWGFKRDKGQCEQFIYGGCRGNGNRFSSMKECEDRCLME